MVELESVVESNSRFANEKHKSLVCVFAGATQGIGFGTLRRLVSMLPSSTFYILGRSEAKFAERLAQLRASAPTCKFVFVMTEVSLIAGMDDAYKQILALEKKVDYLCMSPGGMFFQGAVYTICMTLDLDLWAANDSKEKMTFIHATPGFVNTGTPCTSYPSMNHGVFWWAFISVMQIVSGWIIVHFGFSLEESRQRHAYLFTSDQYPPGSWRTNHMNEITPDNEALTYYRESGWTGKIWNNTLRVWDRALAKCSTS